MSALDVYSAYSAELRSAVEFCRASAQLRPRLGDYLRWEVADAPARELFNRFLSAKPNEERVYQAVIVALQAGFEQFVIDLVDEVADIVTSRELLAEEFEGLFPNVIKHAQRASGVALASVFEPRSYWRIDYSELIKRLASAQTGRIALYGRPFGIRKANLSCEELEKLLGNLGFALPWIDICKDARLQKFLGAASAASSVPLLKKRLTDLLELRNSLAHSQGAESVLYQDLISFLDVIDCFCGLLSVDLKRYASRNLGSGK